MNKRVLLMIAAAALPLNGCTVIAIADAAVSTAVDVAAVTVKGTVAVVDAVIPDGEDESEED